MVFEYLSSFVYNLLACFSLAADLKSVTCETKVSRDHRRQLGDTLLC